MLLPKTPTPSGWSDTRLITISSALLKWLAQLWSSLGTHRAAKALRSGVHG